MRDLLLLLAISLSAACGPSSDGGGGAAALDCAWLAGENCWKTTASAAGSCLPPSSEKGQLSADNKTCVYASGAVVTFDSPVTLPVGDKPTFRFTVTSGGEPCLRYQKNDAGGFELTVQGKTVSERVLPGATAGLELSCPDGSAYSNTAALDLLGCDGSFGGLPGTTWSSTSTSVTFGLMNVATGAKMSMPVFDCQK